MFISYLQEVLEKLDAFTGVYSVIILLNCTISITRDDADIVHPKKGQHFGITIKSKIIKKGLQF